MLADRRTTVLAGRRLLRALAALHRRDPLAPDFRADAVAAQMLADEAARPPAGHRGSTRLGLSAPVLRAVLDDLAERGAVERRGRRFRLPGHVPEMTPELRARADRLLAELHAAGPSPPPAELVARRVGLPAAALDHLRERGELVSLAPGIDYPADVLDRLREEVVRLAVQGPPTVADVRDALGTSRRYAHVLLERFRPPYTPPVTDLDALRDWLDRYIDAWRTYDREAIASLFTEDATYRYNPFDEPIRGRDAIVESWLEAPDEPGTWELQCEPLAVNGNLAVARCLTRYAATSTAPEAVYSNIWVLRLHDDGRVSDFTEWWMQPRRPQEQ